MALNPRYSSLKKIFMQYILWANSGLRMYRWVSAPPCSESTHDLVGKMGM